ncbi:MAG: hypothetical protein QOI95_1026 [Acidimicrobiaceae bacterium]
MTVSVSPETFTLVSYDAAEIASIIDDLVAAIGLPSELDVRLEVDESTPLGRASVASIDPLVITVESGALEDPKRPRNLSRTGSADVLGRLMFRVRDRLDPAFGEPPDDDKLTLPQSVAWDAYCVGRLVRLGFTHYDNRQRRLYHFRNRHGFSDAADDAFERLWTADGLSWSDITALSEGAVGTSAA